MHLSKGRWSLLSQEDKGVAAAKFRFIIYTELALSLGALGTRQQHHPRIVKTINKLYKPDSEGVFPSSG